ncbi:MAG: ion transporter [Pirellulaceae bacterium]|nr:ion transporter [Pirellulaceae bacterium]
MDKIKVLVNSPKFNHIILALIILSGVLVGMETFPQFENATPAGKIIDGIQTAILWCFVVEIVLKIISHGSKPWEYFLQPWNIFDFVIVAVCFIPIGGADGAKYVAVFRMARLLRTLRMVTILPRLQVLVGALLKAIPSLGYIGILLGLHFYVYAVAGTFLFRQNDPQRFGTLPETTLTLFQVLTLEGWNDVLATQYNGSDAEYPDSWKALHPDRVSHAQPVIASVYFVSFIMLGTMIMLNLFTGVIIGSMEEASAERKEEAREEQLKSKGFLTLHDELTLLGDQLATLSERLKGIELKEAQRETADV